MFNNIVISSSLCVARPGQSAVYGRHRGPLHEAAGQMFPPPQCEVSHTADKVFKVSHSPALNNRGAHTLIIHTVDHNALQSLSCCLLNKDFFSAGGVGSIHTLYLNK